jgi:hypothetical protein
MDYSPFGFQVLDAQWVREQFFPMMLDHELKSNKLVELL